MIKAGFFKKMLTFKRYKLKLTLNESKFEEKLLYLLSTYISKYYNKKVIFNIVNLKSFILNSDLFTQILTLKVQDQEANVVKMMKIILNRAELPNVNRVIEKSKPIKGINFNLLENKYKNLNLSNILSKDFDDVVRYPKGSTNLSPNPPFPYEGAQARHMTLDFLLKDAYENNVYDHSAIQEDSVEMGALKDNEIINDIIFNSIKYKNMGGVRLEIRGRLTKRYRADRAVYKFK